MLGTLNEGTPRVDGIEIGYRSAATYWKNSILDG